MFEQRNASVLPFEQLTGAGAKLRVITTSYLGATDLKAVELLHSLPNTEIPVSYDTRRTQLHAKALNQRQVGKKRDLSPPVSSIKAIIVLIAANTAPARIAGSFRSGPFRKSDN